MWSKVSIIFLPQPFSFIVDFSIVLSPCTKIRVWSHQIPIETTFFLRKRFLLCPSDIFPTASRGWLLSCKVCLTSVLHPLLLSRKFCYSHMFFCTLFVKAYHKTLFNPLLLFIVYKLLLNFVTKYYPLSLFNYFSMLLYVFKKKKANIVFIPFSTLWINEHNKPLYWLYK